MGAKKRGFVRIETRRGKRVLVIDIRFVDKQGKPQRFRRDAKCTERGSAEKEAQEIYLRLLSGEPMDATRERAPTFARFVEDTFIPISLATGDFRPETRQNYPRYLRRRILPFFGTKRLDNIKHVDFLKFATTMAADGIEQRPYFCVIRAVLRQAVETGAVEGPLPLPKLPPVGKKVPDAPTADEVRAEVDAATGWLQVAVALAAWAGLRIGEVRAFQVGDIDFARNWITIRRAYSADEILTPKSGHERQVPMIPELADVLREASRAKLPTAPLLITRIGTVPARYTIEEAHKELIAKLGQRHRPFHSLRAHFLTETLRNGANPEAVRLLAGHSSLVITQRYLATVESDLVGAVARLGNSGATTTAR